MNKYIALYKQGPMAWINAESFLEATKKAIDMLEPEKEIPVFLGYKTEQYKSAWFVEKEKRRETSEYQQWKIDKQRIESYNKGRRVGLYKVQEFMPKIDKN